MGREYILSVIKNVTDEWFGAPGGDWPRRYFEQRSCRRWAASEVIRSIEESPLLPPIVVVENFVSRMEKATKESRMHGAMFNTAKEVAEDILDVLNAMK